MIYVMPQDDEIFDNHINHSSDLRQPPGKVIHV